MCRQVRTKGRTLLSLAEDERANATGVETDGSGPLAPLGSKLLRRHLVMVIRPDGVPDGVPEGAATGADFHDLLKARLITLRQPIQLIRPATWRGGKGVEDAATCAWNLFTALYYKSGGKPWRLVRRDAELTRCFVGISFTQSDDSEELLTSVAQVFNELGDGVIVRGGLARKSERDRQPHLSREDAAALLRGALRRYREEHETIPALVTLHKTSSFSEDERRGFADAAEAAFLSRCELIWVSRSERAMLIRGADYYPPLRGTLLSLGEEEFALYTHGSVPYYRTYPGLYVPRTVGIRPCETTRTIEEIATEILALTKLNWNRARLDATWPITLLAARRVGEILQHVPRNVQPAIRELHVVLAPPCVASSSQRTLATPPPTIHLSARYSW